MLLTDLAALIAFWQLNFINRSTGTTYENNLLG